MERKTKNDSGKTQYHPLHRHPMRLKCDEPKPFECSGCKELGFGPRYQCVKSCDFVLHKVCFDGDPQAGSRTHPFTGRCRFQFLWGPPVVPNRRLCAACGGDVRGFVYHDKYKHELDLHPCCMNLKSSMSDPDLRMELTLMDRVPSRCVECERKDLKVPSKGQFRGWSYVSSCGRCCYHVSCVKKLILDNWKRGYFNNVASSSSPSRGRTLSRNETARPIRCKSLGRSDRSLIPPSPLAGRSLSSSRGRTLPRDETARRRRCKSLGRSDRSLIPPSPLARRASSRPPAARFGHGLIKLWKIGLSVAMSVVFGNPAPVFFELVQNL